MTITSIPSLNTSAAPALTTLQLLPKNISVAELIELSNSAMINDIFTQLTTLENAIFALPARETIDNPRDLIQKDLNLLNAPQTGGAHSASVTINIPSHTVDPTLYLQSHPPFDVTIGVTVARSSLGLTMDLPQPHPKIPLSEKFASLHPSDVVLVGLTEGISHGLDLHFL